MNKFPKINTFYILAAIFVLALILRFLYYPNNIYFGYDQARDGFAAQDILKGDLKLVGPTTTFTGLNHGVLFWYLLAPFYFLGQGNPEIASVFLRIFNALGVFFIFYFSKILFGKRAAFLAAAFFAISFEQTQFSIYMGNPALGVLSVMLMYLGLALAIFQKKTLGLPLAFLGLGVSIQFQFALFYLIVPMILIMVVFRKTFFKLPLKTWLLSVLTLFIFLSTFILVEFKYNFRSLHAILHLTQQVSDKSFGNISNTYFYTISKMISFNFTGDLIPNLIILILLLISFLKFLRDKRWRNQLIFLSIWFFALFLTFVINGGVLNPEVSIPLYYPNVGVSVSFLIFTAFLIGQIFSKMRILALLIVGVILLFNLDMINQFNPKGTILEINAQPGMLLQDEKKVLDFIYTDTASQPFAVKAITMPLDINTTWSYLFEHYGNTKYGYLPIWNGKNALGFPGDLKVQEAQEGLPAKRYVIIEPTRGIPTKFIDDFLNEEGYFTKLDMEQKFGNFIVQRRVKF